MVKRVVFDLLATGWDWDESRWAGSGEAKRSGHLEIERLLAVPSIEADSAGSAGERDEKSYFNACFRVVYVY